MRAGFSYCFLAALALSALPATAAGQGRQRGSPNAAARTPTGRWVVNFADAQCVATRNYGTAEEPLVLALKAPAAGNVLQVAVLRRGTGSRNPRQLPATIALDGGAPVSISMLEMPTPQEGQRVYRVILPLERFDGLRRSSRLTIRGVDEFRETFDISGMGEVLRVMDECVADLRRAWNAPEGETMSPALRERAAGSLDGIFRWQDYPGAAFQELSSGRVGVVILIDETGRVADCTVTETSGVAALDAQSCAIISQRARYRPAVGRDGRPARDVNRAHISWRVG